MSGQFTASLPDLQEWARVQMQRAPDFVIGDNYLRRWWIVPRNDYANVYLHEILVSDDDRAVHDHPWNNQSFLIDGEYIEHRPMPDDPMIMDRFRWTAGAIVTRVAEQAHRLEIPSGGRAVSLFITGPTIREWGFHCPNGWRHWKDFVDGRNAGSVGRGCD